MCSHLHDNNGYVGLGYKDNKEHSKKKKNHIIILSAYLQSFIFIFMIKRVNDTMCTLQLGVNSSYYYYNFVFDIIIYKIDYSYWFYYNFAFDIIIIKRGSGSARLEESDLHPSNLMAPGPQYQRIDRKKRLKTRSSLGR